MKKSIMKPLHFVADELQDPRVIALLQEHLNDMHASSPPESVHALDLSGLRQPDIRFWSVWTHGDEGAQVIGTCALKHWTSTLSELKSMRVIAARRGQGDAQQILDYVLDEARKSGVQRVSLETGTVPFFAPARRFYERNGFTYCEPFGDYELDPYSCFMTREI